MKRRFNFKRSEPGYVSMTELGNMFGVTSHVIGRWLRGIGLRTKNNRPSQRAFDQDLTKPIRNGQGYYYVWHATKAIEALKEADHEPIGVGATCSGGLQ